MEINTQANGGHATQPDLQSDSVPATVTTTKSEKKRYGVARGPSAMSKVVIKKAQGKKFKVRCNYIGVIIGRVRHTLQSYIRMLARTIILIDIKSWPFVERELKNKLWKYIQGDKKKLRKPPTRYGFVGTSQITERKSDAMKVKAGRLKPGEKLDRAILWKKARMTKKCIVVDPDLAVVVKRISSRSGKLCQPQTMVRFSKKKCKIIKTKLLARDRQRDKEMERTRHEMELTKLKMERTKQEMERTKQEMAELKYLISASNLMGSPLSDNASFQEKAGPKEAVKTTCVLTKMKEMNVDDEIEYVGGDSPPPEKKAPRSCELSVDNIKNKVAFGSIFDDPMNSVVHGVPMQPEHVRVSMDGAIQADSLLPLPIEGELETVRQAIGSTVSWPQDLITVASPVNNRKEGFSAKRKEKNQLQSVTMFKEVEVTDSVPKGFNLLYKHATTIMKENEDSIVIPCDTEGSSKQPGGHECGYVVMRNMKDIIEDKEMTFITKWANKSRKSYKMEKLDVVRIEALAYIQDKI
ncbi:hypothetical protein AgCh_029157 [Apium graveolens]